MVKMWTRVGFKKKRPMLKYAFVVGQIEPCIILLLVRIGGKKRCFRYAKFYVEVIGRYSTVLQELCGWYSTTWTVLYRPARS